MHAVSLFNMNLNDNGIDFKLKDGMEIVDFLTMIAYLTVTRP